MTTPAIFGMKAISVFPGNHGTEHDSHNGVVMLFEPEGIAGAWSRYAKRFATLSKPQAVTRKEEAL